MTANRAKKVDLFPKLLRCRWVHGEVGHFEIVAFKIFTFYVIDIMRNVVIQKLIAF